MRVLTFLFGLLSRDVIFKQMSGYSWKYRISVMVTGLVCSDLRTTSVRIVSVCHCMWRAPFRVPKLHRTRSTADIFTIDIQPRQCENQTVTYAFTLSSCGSVCVYVGVRLCVLACVCVFAYIVLIKASFVNTLGERYHLTRHSHLQQYPSARVYISGKS